MTQSTEIFARKPMNRQTCGWTQAEIPSDRTKD